MKIGTEEIDVIRLYSGTMKGFEDDAASTAHDKWNKWLSRCVKYHNLDGLMSTRRGLQMGMATAQKNGLVTEGLAELFARWIGSIDRSIKKIVKARALTGNDFIDKKHHDKKNYKTKQERDAELEKYLRKKSY